MARTALLVLSLAVFAPAARSAPIVTRTELQTILGGPGTLENFENFNVSPGVAANLACATLTSTAVCNGQGPGLVVPGISFPFALAPGQWNGQAYFGAPSKELLANGQPMIVDFTTPAAAFGVDLRSFSGFSATATVEVYAADDSTLLGTITAINLEASGMYTFAGWEHSPGIGSFRLTQTNYSWSPIIDNLEFGPADLTVPEPSSTLLLAAGLLALCGLRKSA